MKTKTNTIKTGVVAGLCALSLMAGGVGVAATAPATASACETAELEATASTTSVVEMNRLYNQWSGEHFYTANKTEKSYLVSIGWTDEGVGWYAPSTGDKVYRLYNPYSGEHHYTMSSTERDTLDKLGWDYEGVGWYSDTNKGVPLYRLYNPYETGAGSHHYTTNKTENDDLTKIGWNYEGVAWYGVDTSKTNTDTDKKDDTTKDDGSDTSTHTHVWTTVEHPAVTTEVTEKQPRYGIINEAICNVCGEDMLKDKIDWCLQFSDEDELKSDIENAMIPHQNAHMDAHEGSGYHVVTKYNQVIDYRTVTKTKVVTPAWSETVCKDCGAKKQQY